MSLIVKIKALFLIGLLAGHEAARLHQGARTEAARRAANALMQPDESGPPPDIQVEKFSKSVGTDKDMDGPTAASRWQQENWQCEWSTFSMGCVGPGNDTSVCKYRSLPLDAPVPFSSESCRLSDKYMLTHDRPQYFQMQAKLLSEKAERFEKDCNGASMFNLYCHRRAKHMYRSMMFLSKAQDKKFLEGMSEKEKAADKAAFDDALQHMKKFAGEDMEYVMMLKDKMKAQGKANSKTIETVVTLLTKLLQGTPEEREEARTAIKDMPSEAEPMTSDEQAEQEQMLANVENHEAEIQELLENRLSELDPDDELSPPQQQDDVEEDENDESGSSSALVQSDAALEDVSVKVVVKGIVFIIITFLIISAIIWAILTAMSILIGLSLVILIGCACYDLGRGNGQLSGSETFNCIANIFKWPIEQGGKAIEWFFDEFTPNEFQ